MVDTINMLRVREKLEKNYFQLKKAKKKKRRKSDIDTLEKQASIVLKKIKKNGDFLTEEEKELLLSTESCGDGCKENFISF